MVFSSVVSENFRSFSDEILELAEEFEFSGSSSLGVLVLGFEGIAHGDGVGEGLFVLSEFGRGGIDNTLFDGDAFDHLGFVGFEGSLFGRESVEEFVVLGDGVGVDGLSFFFDSHGVVLNLDEVLFEVFEKSSDLFNIGFREVSFGDLDHGVQKRSHEGTVVGTGELEEETGHLVGDFSEGDFGGTELVDDGVGLLDEGEGWLDFSVDKVFEVLGFSFSVNFEGLLVEFDLGDEFLDLGEVSSGLVERRIASDVVVLGSLEGIGGLLDGLGSIFFFSGAFNGLGVMDFVVLDLFASKSSLDTVEVLNEEF